MRMNCKYLFIGMVLQIVLITLGFSSRAAVEKTTNSVAGTQIIPGANLSIADLYFNSITTGSYLPFENRSSVIEVGLMFDETNKDFHGDWGLTVNYNICLYDANGMMHSLSGQQISIDFDNSLTHKDKAIKRYEGYYKASVKIMSVTPSGSLSTIPPDIRFELNYETERFYSLATGAPPKVGWEYHSDENLLELKWDHIFSAESYDIEWLFIDIGDGSFGTGYDFDFKNATRINVHQHFYNISMAYPRGILLFRVRPVGIDESTGYRVEGTWSYVPAGGHTTNNAPTLVLQNVSYVQKYEFAGLHADMNWNYTVAYAENGKRIEQIGYADGLMRGRQSVTINQEEQLAIVGQTIYDFVGRPAITVIPAPASEWNGVHFYEGWSKYDMTTYYGIYHFDIDSKIYTPEPMDAANSAGAAKYYSSSNGGLGVQGTYTADAEGYPYMRTRYKNDGTDRVVQVSGVGKEYFDNSGAIQHDTKIYYGTPSSQEELDRLFGNEVGPVEMYKKQTVIDANEQATVTYTDNEGRVIVTALAGDAPDNLHDIDTRPTTFPTVETDLTPLNTLTADHDGWEIMKSFTVSTSSEYVFEYYLDESTFCDDCLDDPETGETTEGCVDCHYDIEIKLINTITEDIVDSYSASDVTAVASSGTPVNFTHTLAPGEYAIIKKLTLNTASFQQAVADYANSQYCLEVEPETAGDCNPTCNEQCTAHFIFTNSSGNTVYLDESGTVVAEYDGMNYLIGDAGDVSDVMGLIDQCEADCQAIIDLQLSECDMKYNGMLADMSPGGQYFDNLTFGSFSPATNTWLNTNVVDDASGFTAWFQSNIDGGASPADWNDVRSGWNASWAVQLLPFHPEYCTWQYYCDVSCEFEGGSVNMDDIEAYNNALLSSDPCYFSDCPTNTTVNDGEALFNPAGVSSSTNTSNPWTYQPFDVPVDADLDPMLHCKTAIVTDLQNALLHYVPTVTGTPGSTDYMSIWYVIEDPDGIAGANGGNTTGIAQHVIDLFDAVHGDGVNPGFIGSGSGQVSRFQYFVAAYNFFKNELLYLDFHDNYAGTGSCVDFMDVNLETGFNDEGFHVWYPQVDIFANYPLDSAGVVNMALNQGVTVCEQYADDWIATIAPCSLDSASESQVRQYLIEICAEGYSANYPFGSDDVNTGSGNAVSEGTFAHTGPYETFGEVLLAYGCSTEVVHPLASVPDASQAECDCANFAAFLATQGFPASSPGSQDLSDILDQLEDAILTTGESGNVTTGNISDWYTECANMSSGHPDHATLTGDNFPSQLQCESSYAPPSLEDVENVCETALDNLAYINALVVYNNLLVNAQNAYQENLRAYCLNIDEREHFTMEYTINEYHYTLYYYDQAGNLLKTVPPEGVHPIDQADWQDIQDHRDHPTDPTYPFIWPDHTLVSKYWYQSLQQPTVQATPDGGFTFFYYDELSRLVLSQDARQSALSTQRYSYALYDGLGRVYESGEMTPDPGTPFTSAILSDYSGSFIPWVNDADAMHYEMTQVQYETTLSSTVNGYFGANGQENLRNRVASSIYYETYDPGTPPADYLYASHYSYDIHGNVKTYIAENKILEDAGQSLKKTTYSYDLVSGNVNEVRYQEDEYDEFYTRYGYDQNNRVKEVHTSRDGVIWEQEADYFYYAHGPLARTELGDRLVQASDYTYTLQGWLKGVNSNTLDEERDPGLDSYISGTSMANLNEFVGRDAFGFTLGYYQGDYTDIGGAASFEATTSGNTLFTKTKSNLYNGNIGHMVTALSDLNSDAITPQAMAYEYDQLNRIKLAESNQGITVATNTWGSYSGTNAYAASYTYDGNGNITTLTRRDGTGTLMDDLTYDYNFNGSSQLTDNRLNYVDDAIGSCVNYTDVDDQSSGNYTYDNTGRLLKDASEYITNIMWNNKSKVRYVIKDKSENLSPCDLDGNMSYDDEVGMNDIEFLYDELGRRICKIEKPHNAAGGGLKAQKDWIYTWYVHDAGGNVMSIYKQEYEDQGSGNYNMVITQLETPLYGSTRLGEALHSQDDERKKTIPFTASTTTNTVDLVNGGSLNETIFTSVVYGTLPDYDNAWHESTVGNVTELAYMRELGNKTYELTNHLGNVLETVSDRRLMVQDGATSKTLYYTAQVESYSDYYPFGMAMPGRNGSAGGYRYGFNGMEKDNEVKGSGNQYNYGFRCYDPRLGRFLSVDPLAESYPFYSSYQFAGNRPIEAIDLDGLEEYFYQLKRDSENDGTTLVKLNYYKQIIDNDRTFTITFTIPYLAINGVWLYEQATVNLAYSDFGLKVYFVNYHGEWKRVPDPLNLPIEGDDAWEAFETYDEYQQRIQSYVDSYNTLTLLKDAYDLMKAINFHKNEMGAGIRNSNLSANSKVAGRGWRVGDPIRKLTRAGKVPSWSTIRSRYWKNKATTITKENCPYYSKRNIERMRKGQAPKVLDEGTGKYESMELHHPKGREGDNIFEFEEVTPSQHAAKDPQRRLKGQKLNKEKGENNNSE